MHVCTTDHRPIPINKVVRWEHFTCLDEAAAGNLIWTSSSVMLKSVSSSSKTICVPSSPPNRCWFVVKNSSSSLSLLMSHPYCIIHHSSTCLGQFSAASGSAQHRRCGWPAANLPWVAVSHNFRSSQSSRWIKWSYCPESAQLCFLQLFTGGVGNSLQSMSRNPPTPRPSQRGRRQFHSTHFLCRALCACLFAWWRFHGFSCNVLATSDISVDGGWPAVVSMLSNMGFEGGCSTSLRPCKVATAHPKTNPKNLRTLTPIQYFK